MKKKTNRCAFGILLFLIIFNSYFPPLCAQNEIPDSVINERLQYIKKTLKQDQINTRRWWYGWLGSYSAATIGQSAVYLTSNDKSMRQDMALGAATTLLGVAGQFITPLIPGNEPEKLNSLPTGTSAEQKVSLAIAEELLKECAFREKLARSWKNHATCSAVNLGGGLITWLGFHRTVWDGIGYFALNSVITETQIWTQPTLAKRNYKNYRQKYQESAEGLSYVPNVSWYLEAYPGGLGIKAVF